MKKIISAVLVLLLTFCAAAETIAFEGTAVSTATEACAFIYGGTVSSVNIGVGDRVSEGDVLYTIETTKVYASQSGTLRLFGDEGDDCADVTARYGAVAYIEPEVQYTMSCSTSSAYDSEANRVIHPGEKVYLRSYSTYTHTGTGMVTSVSGTSFSVEVTSGSFDTGESVNVFRNASFDSSTRIGRGSISHADPVAYAGEGLIVSFGAKNGDTVTRGQVLFETVSGAYTGDTSDHTRLTAPASGVISAVSASKGSSVSTGSAACEILPDSALRIQITVGEADLSAVTAGMSVDIELPYYMDGEIALKGTVEKISLIGEAMSADDAQAGYTVYIIPENSGLIRYGMNAIVTVTR